ncbi:Hypothetical predicted protein [Mytilus galloprovincialis]|uniref:Uncharacterized protein n=1 Tax=Mytilus galloprovincialis TaxID=29158 RepID=A0A8B6HH00_MYTGA|nr:Hypothetical predicted protein [Mytilus galloprovincialis]
MQTDLFEEYSIKTVFPIHLQLLTIPGTILALIGFVYVFIQQRLMKSSPDHPFPMLVKVFLYNNSYDLRLPETKDAEKKGVEAAKKKVYLSESDHSKIMTKLTEMEKKSKDVPQEDRSTVRKYLPTKLQNAYQAVKDSDMAVHGASIVYSVPLTTLRDRVDGRVHIDTVKSGPSPLFTQEEEA